MLNDDLIKKLTQIKILVVGDVMLDRYWMGDSDRISPEAPIPVVKINKHDNRLGGAANVALNIAKLGVNVSLIGAIANDEAGIKLENMLKNNNIKNYLQQDKNYISTLKLRVLARNQQMLRLDFEEKVNDILLTKIHNTFNDIYANYDAIILSDYAKGCLKNSQDLITAAKQKNIPVIVDPKGNNFNKYKHASILTPNLKEFSAVADEWHNENELDQQAFSLIEKLNLGALLITRSSDGMTLYSQGNKHHFNAQVKEVFDVSGAGDTVISTLTSFMCITKDIVISTKLASLAAGIVISKLGTSSIELSELCEITATNLNNQPA